MIVEKLKHIKRSKELVAFASKLDDTIPKIFGKLCVCRESDGKMFYVAHIFAFDEVPECQDPVIIVIGDMDGYLKEGDDISFFEEPFSSYKYDNHKDDFYRKHDIPGGWWRGVGGMPDTYKCSGYCQLCGVKCGKEKHF